MGHRNWTLSDGYGPDVMLTPREVEENEKGDSAHLCGTTSLARIVGIVKNNGY